MVELPLMFPALGELRNKLPPYLIGRRELTSTSVRELGNQLDFLARIDILLDYGSSLYELHMEDGNSNEKIDQDLIICLVDAAFFYREVSLDVIQGAYGSEKMDGAWSTGGCYLRKGLGLLEFILNWLLSCSAIDDKRPLCSLIEDMMAEFRVLQAIGVVVLSLSKLRTKMYKDQKDAILDFHEEDLRGLATNSLLYAKLVIGCLDIALKCNPGTIINKSLFAYLNSLIFLLLSLDEYNKDETGIAIGMIERSADYISKLVHNSHLNDPLSKYRKRDRLKNALHKRPLQRHLTASATHSTGLSSDVISWIRKDKSQNLLILLQQTLDDFLLPLIFLLRYKYRQANDKINFKPIKDEESDLRRLFPRGKAPDVQLEHWEFDQRIHKLASRPGLNSGGGYY